MDNQQPRMWLCDRMEQECLSIGLGVDSKAQAEQVRSVAANRIGERTGVLPFELMQRLDDALRLHLDL